MPIQVRIQEFLITLTASLNVKVEPLFSWKVFLISTKISFSIVFAACSPKIVVNAFSKTSGFLGISNLSKLKSFSR